MQSNSSTQHPIRSDNSLGLSTPDCFFVLRKKDIMYWKLSLGFEMKIKGGVWGMISPPVDVSPADATGVCQLHPNAGWITLTGDNGVLQFYDIMKDRHIKLLQVPTNKNRIQFAPRMQAFSMNRKW